ncbi:hypothetical protein HAX54_032691 [Datura stramonium]|uniref:Uncharacterized protein n=1 Tax=Datura stramonium TaxID=4076 RepID=A0ABS8VB64_DATST|nr:hypothetical protein [Datura stramonium]
MEDELVEMVDLHNSILHDIAIIGISIRKTGAKTPFICYLRIPSLLRVRSQSSGFDPASSKSSSFIYNIDHALCPREQSKVEKAGSINIYKEMNMLSRLIMMANYLRPFVKIKDQEKMDKASSTCLINEACQDKSSFTNAFHIFMHMLPLIFISLLISRKCADLSRLYKAVPEENN